MTDFDLERYARSVTEGVAQAIRLSTIRERLGCGDLVPAVLAAQTAGQSWAEISDEAREMWLHDAKWALEASGTIDLMVAYQQSESRRNELADANRKLQKEIDEMTHGTHEMENRGASDAVTPPADTIDSLRAERDLAEATAEQLRIGLRRVVERVRGLGETITPTGGTDPRLAYIEVQYWTELQDAVDELTPDD